MKILLSGSTGLIGSELKRHLNQNGHSVISLIRNKSSENSENIFWDYTHKILDVNKIENVDAVIHLAGENISAKRWTANQKQKILESRIESTNFLVDSISKLEQPPKSFFCASAIGFYGNRGNEELQEDSQKGTGFLADVCEQWELAAKNASVSGIRTVNLRFGVIFSQKGGALKKMMLPFKFGIGGKIGSGRQYLSWISLSDTINAIYFCLNQQKIEGPVNIVASNPVTNTELTQTLGKVLKRPTIFPLPAFVAKLVLGEMAEELLLSSTRATPSVLTSNGFEFKHNSLVDFLNMSLK